MAFLFAELLFFAIVVQAVMIYYFLSKFTSMSYLYIHLIFIIVYMVTPIRLGIEQCIVKRFYQGDSSDQIAEYKDMKLRFFNDYDRCNPMTKEKASH